ncbi:MAG: transcription termination/antitermination factor NusG [Rickettsia sp.]|nr:transcription termination/antitermination factor NusG [Rickettsia sp.]
MFDWYVLYTSSGNEKKIKDVLEEHIKKIKVEKFFEDIVVPVVEIPEVKRGKKILTEKKMMPGYLLLKMEMNDISLGVVKQVAKNSGFLGGKNYPVPLSKKEVSEIFGRLQKEKQNVKILAPYKIGDKIEILEGPFDSFSGTVDSVDLNAQKLKISVSIFGKATPIVLKFDQVNKIE